ncbi:MAG: hypothetical protein NWE94_10360 [Candidatus Bathyarchaeota archaeon]|nr:hypothetical protein [Candidatus Bathyarchaeota archaeon]
MAIYLSFLNKLTPSLSMKSSNPSSISTLAPDEAYPASFDLSVQKWNRLEKRLFSFLC